MDYGGKILRTERLAQDGQVDVLGGAVKTIARIASRQYDWQARATGLSQARQVDATDPARHDNVRKHQIKGLTPVQSGQGLGSIGFSDHLAAHFLQKSLGHCPHRCVVFNQQNARLPYPSHKTKIIDQRLRQL